MNNLLESLRFTSTDIEEFLVHNRVKFFPKNERDDIEWGEKLPMFVIPFYDYSIEAQMIPSQAGYHQRYLSDNPDAWHFYNKEQMLAIEARVYRAYPSFVRDIHLAKTLETKGHLVYYHTTIDTEWGIDLVVDDILGVDLFVDSPSSWYARKLKLDRAKTPTNLQRLEIPINRAKDSVRYGNTDLYTYHHVDIIERELKKVHNESHM